MATKIESDYPSSPPNDASDGEEPDSSEEKEELPIKKPTNNNVQDLLKRLQSSGALIKKPKEEYHCFTCDEDFDNWKDLEKHLITHVSLPSVVVDKLPSDDEDVPQSGDEDWSEEEEAPPPETFKTPQKVDISQLLKKTGISINKSSPNKTSDAAISKLGDLGFTIKKTNTPVKKEPEIDNESDVKPKKELQEKNNDIMQKLGNLGGIKLKLKSDGASSNSFKVVNGLKDFKASDDEDDDDENEKHLDSQDGDSDDDPEKSGEQEGSGPEEDSDDDVPLEQRKTKNVVNTKQTPVAAQKIANALKNLQGKAITKMEPQNPPANPVPVNKATPKGTPVLKPVGRPNMKQTPKRGANLPLPSREPAQVKEVMSSGTSSNSTPERRQSHDVNIENVVVKKEIDTPESRYPANDAPLFTSQIKTERSSPPPTAEEKSTPIIASVKSEPEPVPTSQCQPIFLAQPPSSNTLPPVTKSEDTIIEINGDSNDEDDDCCVVSATPAPDIKPVVPKTEPLQSSYALPAYPTSSQGSYASTLPTSRTLTVSSLEKQHNFNWNAPDSKPAIDILEKSADDIFESLLSNHTKKEGLLSEASEYISLDTLGPQYSCDVCNTRFTEMSMLENHIRTTGHSRSIVTPSSSSTLLPYNPSSSNILQSLLPVKQMVEQVGKIGLGSGPGFTHQQNVMINIQAYPGAGGMMQQQPAYNSYGQPMPGQTMPGQNMPGYGQTSSGLYGAAPGQQMPGQYPNQNFMGQQTAYGQFQPPMSKPSYPGAGNTFDNTPMYSSASPLQSMQQAVYGQPQVGQMGPPPVPTNNPYVPSSSPGGSMKPPANNSGIRIQNIQTFPPGGQVMGMPGQGDGQQPIIQPNTPGQMMGGQMPPPGQIRMAAGANVNGPRPRMPGVRGQRPGIRPGIQIRGSKPRMPMKRPGVPVPGPTMKKRPSVLLPGKHDNEDCQVMALQKQREGMPMIKSVQGAGEKLNLGSQISITKKTVNKEANAMANVLASRGISVKQKQKSRSPSPERPLPHIPNLGAGMSIKHTSKSSSFSIPEAKVGGGMLQCRICKKMFMNQNSLAVHMSAAHPQSKLPMFKCEECPASYPKILQLQHHKRVFHNVLGPNRELGLPVVDMSQDDNLQRLSSLGIYSYIPLAGKEQGGGTYGIPIISVHNMQNGMTNSLQALGADGLLSLGPLKPLPN